MSEFTNERDYKRQVGLFSGPQTFSIDSRYVITPEQLAIYDGFDIIQFPGSRKQKEARSKKKK